MNHSRRRGSLAIQTKPKGNYVTLIIALLILSTSYIILLSTKVNESSGIYDELDASIESASQSVTHTVVVSKNEPAITLLKHDPFRPNVRWMYVSSQHSLPKNYMPTKLVNANLAQGGSGSKMKVSSFVRPALAEMFRSAEKDGIKLILSSAYRSDSEQRTVYSNYVQDQGIEAARRFVANPGESEHATGLAVDINTHSDACTNDIAQCSISNETGEWLEKHAPSYGFILRYPKDKEAITGISSEPWHFRYVGNGALSLTASGMTLDELVQKVSPKLLEAK
jgi:D-alanyl-D-alanine carboxypeptidase